MKKEMLAVGVMATGLLVLAPNAGAEPAPPLPEGMYNQIAFDGAITQNIQLRYDCGAGCFTLDGLDEPGPGTQYRFANNRWESPWVPYDAPCADGQQAGVSRYYTWNGRHLIDEYNFTKYVCGRTAAEATEYSNTQARSGPPFGTLTPA